MSWRYVFGGILALSAMEAILTSTAASGRVAGALTGVNTAAQYLLSPSYPLIPDRRVATATAQYSYGTPIPIRPPVEGAH